MQYFLSLTLSTFLVLSTFTSFAQESAQVEKALLQAVAQTKGSSVNIPLMEDGKAKDKLAKAVASSINATLRSTRKSGIWSVQNLSSEQVQEIALSGAPFSSLVDIKGKSVTDDFEQALSQELDKKKVFGLIEDMNRSEVVDEIVLSTFSKLDQNGSKALDKIDS